MEKYTTWLENAVEDSDLTKELESIEGNEAEILDRFYRELEFGTGGLRGVIGAGENRMNIYTVRKATQGLADYLNSRYETSSVAISFDSRIKSDLFAREAARVLAGNGIQVHIFTELNPTPVLSFAVRQLGCQGGIMVTASHNPSKYNGYKCYGPDGCQMTDNDAADVTRFIRKVDLFGGVKKADYMEAVVAGGISEIPAKLVEDFLACVAGQQVNQGICKHTPLSVVYTPLNGTGNKPVREILHRIGVKSVSVVPEQELPDGNFPTAPYPNPEIRQAFECAIKLAETVRPDLLLATDPDCDRVGIAIAQDGDYRLMSGNEMGCMLLDYILKSKSAAGTLPENPTVVKTIVTSDLAARIAEKYGCQLIEVLTGFKYIGEQITLLEKAGNEDRYVFGFEESYGYLSGGYVRDKDGVVASMLVCEMAAYYKSQGKTLLDVMNDLYKEHGVYQHTMINAEFEGAQGMETMKALMSGLRENRPTEIAGLRVVLFSDYMNSIAVDIQSGQTNEIHLPKSNVLSFGLEGNAGLIVRPSGTEPKIKAYITATGSDAAKAAEMAKKLTAAAKELLKV
ncbi:MAG TPA: phosphoglucomutase [Ruminococcaceae bacterium]|nr:phosphoglucomutase [Oscillospiraceae bacterium]